MIFGQRHNDPVERKNPGPGTPGGDALARLRSAGEEFLAAGDDAINRALSGNSEAFLAANRQQGGE